MQKNCLNYFQTSADADELWQRLHLSLAEFGVTHVLYAIGHMIGVVYEEHLTRVLDNAHIRHPFYVKTSFPEELMNTKSDGYRLDEDIVALHSITSTTPFIWSEFSDALENTPKAPADASKPFWFDVNPIGVTLPLRFGQFGKGGLGLWMSRLSEKEFDKVWEDHQDQIAEIVRQFDYVARRDFLDLVGITVTEREREVLAFLTQGLSAKMIAESLGTKTNTVQNQISRLRSKLGAQNNVQLASIATTFEII